jgi:hypothetical protein
MYNKKELMKLEIEINHESIMVQFFLEDLLALDFLADPFLLAPPAFLEDFLATFFAPDLGAALFLATACLWVTCFLGLAEASAAAATGEALFLMLLETLALLPDLFETFFDG